MSNHRVSVEAYTAHAIERHGEAMAQSLEYLAARVRDHTRVTVSVISNGGHAMRAGTVQREIMSALMNLHIDQLTALATDAELARERGE